MDELRVRGKRTRRQPQGTAIAGPRLRGRPMKPASELVANKMAQLKHRSTSLKEPSSSISVKIIQARSSLSHLERLPTELVQQIFFHCLEVNMVKASPVITKMLSTHSTYKLLILFAFFDDDGINPVEADHFKPATYRKMPIGEKIRLQEAILDCQWCSLERIERCMPTLTRLKMVQEWYNEYNITKSWPTDPPVKWLSPINPPSLPHLEDSQALKHYFHVHPRYLDTKGIATTDETLYFPWLRPYDLMLTDDGDAIKQVASYRTGNHLGIPSTLAARHIPDKLLTGRPWTMEKLKFLKLLRQGFRHLQRDLSLHLSAEALFRGMEVAIVENDPDALLVLLELHDAAFHIASQTISHQPVVNNNPHGQRYTTRHSHPIPLQLFWLATKHERRDAEVLISLLLRAGLDSIPKDDPTMTKWALEAGHDDPTRKSIAAFVLRYMEGAFSWNDNNALFSHGAILGNLSSRYNFNSKVSFSAEIGYEMPTRYAQFSVEVESGNYI